MSRIAALHLVASSLWSPTTAAESKWLSSATSMQAYLRDAVNASPQSADAWYLCGLVCKTQGNIKLAETSLLKSAELKAVEPILPFSEHVPFAI